MMSKWVFVFGMMLSSSLVAFADWAGDYAAWMKSSERYSHSARWQPLLAAANADDSLAMANFALADARARRAGALTVCATALWRHSKDAPFGEQLAALERLHQLTTEFGESSEISVVREIEAKEFAAVLKDILYEEIPAEQIVAEEVPTTIIGCDNLADPTAVGPSDILSVKISTEQMAAEEVPARTFGHDNDLPVRATAGADVGTRPSELAAAVYSQLMKKADAFLRDGQLSEARSTYIKALTLESERQTLSPASSGIVRTFQEGGGCNVQACREWAAKNLKTATQRMRIEVAFGELYYRDQDYGRAIECLTPVAGNQSAAGQSASLVLALCQLGKGARADALATLRSVETNRITEEIGAKALFLMGWVHLQAQEYGEARTAFNALPQRYPKSQFVTKAAELNERLKSYRR